MVNIGVHNTNDSKRSYSSQVHLVRGIPLQSINRLKTEVLLQGKIIAVSHEETRFKEIHVYNRTVIDDSEGWVEYKRVYTLTPSALKADLHHFSDFK